MAKSNGWNEWSKHVLSEINRLNDCYKKLDNEIDRLSIESGKLNIKAGIWGAMAALIPTLIITIIYILSRSN